MLSLTIIRPTGVTMSGEFLEIKQDRDKLRVFGDLRLSTLGYFTSALFKMAERSGYRDIVLDLSSLSSIYPSCIPPIAAYLRKLTRDDKVEFSLFEPRNQNVKSKVIGLGLAHYIDHRKYPKPRANSSDASLLQFMDHSEREIAVEKVMNSALRTSRLDRRHIAALDWAVNEITDNVLTHSESKIGGFLICNKVAKTNIIEFTVADAGIGVAKSLKIADE